MVNGADVNTSAVFTKKQEEATGEVRIISKFKPGAEEDNGYRTVIFEKDSKSYSFLVEVVSGLTVTLPIGTYNVSCSGAVIRNSITVQANRSVNISFEAY